MCDKTAHCTHTTKMYITYVSIDEKCDITGAHSVIVTCIRYMTSYTIAQSTYDLFNDTCLTITLQ